MPKRMIKVRVITRDGLVLYEAVLPTRSKTMGARAHNVLAYHCSKALAKFPTAYEADATFTHA